MVHEGELRGRVYAGHSCLTNTPSVAANNTAACFGSSQAQHVDPEEAVAIHKAVRSRRSVGVHWGTWPLADERWREPVEALEAARVAGGVGEEEFMVLGHGEGVGTRERGEDEDDEDEDEKDDEDEEDDEEEDEEEDEEDEEEGAMRV